MYSRYPTNERTTSNLSQVRTHLSICKISVRFKNSGAVSVERRGHCSCVTINHILSTLNVGMLYAYTDSVNDTIFYRMTNFVYSYYCIHKICMWMALANYVVYFDRRHTMAGGGGGSPVC